MGDPFTGPGDAAGPRRWRAAPAGGSVCSRAL